MADLVQSATRNILLRTLSADDFALLAPHLEPRKEPKGTILVEKGATIEHVWFLKCGIGSIVTVSAEGHLVESGLYGRDASRRYQPHSAAIGLSTVF